MKQFLMIVLLVGPLFGCQSTKDVLDEMALVCSWKEPHKICICASKVPAGGDIVVTFFVVPNRVCGKPSECE